MTTQIDLTVTVTIDGKDSDSAGDNLRKLAQYGQLELPFLEMIRQEFKGYEAAGDWRIVRAIALTGEGVKVTA